MHRQPHSSPHWVITIKRAPASYRVGQAALSGINFLAFRQSKIYIRFGPTEHNFFSERVIGSESPFQKSSKPVVATEGTGFSSQWQQPRLAGILCSGLEVRPDQTHTSEG
jgi:hypothetical protein